MEWPSTVTPGSVPPIRAPTSKRKPWLALAARSSGLRREAAPAAKVVPSLRILLNFLRKGDTLVVTRVDRLARSIGDLQDIVRLLKERGVALKATEQPIDTSTAAGRAFLDMLGVFAEFETNLRRERQLEGIAKAKAAGVYKGRKPSIDRKVVARLKAEGVGARRYRETAQHRSSECLSGAQ